MTHILIDDNFAGVPKETAQQYSREELPPEGICDSGGGSPPKSHSGMKGASQKHFPQQCTSAVL